MRRRTLTIIVLLYAAALMAQVPNIAEELRQQLRRADSDTVRIRLLDELANEYMVIDTLQAFSILEELHEVAEMNKISKGLGTYYNSKGDIYYYHGEYARAIVNYQLAQNQFQISGDDSELANSIVDVGNSHLFLSQYEEALKKYQTALDLFRGLNDIKGMSRTLNNMGIIHKNFGEYEDALAKYREVVEIYLERDMEEDLMDTYVNIGVVYVLRGEYHLALENFNAAFELGKRYNNKEIQAMCLMNSGVIHTKMADHAKALDLYEKALQVSLEIDDKVEISKCLTNIGTIYIELNELDKAEDYILRGLEIKKALGDRRSIATCYNFLAEIEYHRNNYDQAIDFDLEALRIKKDVNNPEGLAQTYGNLGKTYLAKGKYSDAILYADSSLKISLEIGSLEHVVTAYETLQKAAEQQGRYKKALELANFHQIYSDSLWNESKTRALKEAEFKFESNSLTEENERLKLKAELDRLLLQRNRKFLYYLIAGAILLASIIILMITIQRKQRQFTRSLSNKNKIITNQNNELENLNLTKDKVLSVITHDLRGTIGNQLTALDVLAREEFRDEEERKVVFSRLANSATLSLEILENLALWIKFKEDRILYEPEKGFLDQTVREVLETFEESFNNKEILLKISIDDQVECYYDKSLMRSMIKNLVSNSVKFSSRGGKVLVNLVKNGANADLKITDEGAGMATGEIEKLQKGDISKMRRGTENEKGSGLGYPIIRRILDFHKLEIQIESTVGKGTTVYFSVPVAT